MRKCCLWGLLGVAALSSFVIFLALYKPTGPPLYSNVKSLESILDSEVISLPPHRPLLRKQCLVTGANGFLALNLIEALLTEGWEVIGMHRNTSDIGYLQDLKLAHSSRLTLVIGDVTDLQSLLKGIPQGLDVVFHTAALVSFWSRHADLQYATNVLGTRNVVDACLTRGVHKVIYTSTIGIYLQSTEAVQSPITELSQKHGATSFAAYVHTKYLAEGEIAHGIRKGQWSCTLTPPNILGRYDLHAWGFFVRQISEGTIPKLPQVNATWASAKEVADAHIKAAESCYLGEHYLLGGPVATYQQFASLTAKEVGLDRPAPPVRAWVLRAFARALDLWSYISRNAPLVSPELALLLTEPMVVDSSKAQKELGFKGGSLTMEQLVKDTVADYYKYGKGRWSPRLISTMEGVQKATDQLKQEI